MEEKCFCASKHVPLPMHFYKILVGGEVTFVCPTTYFNLQRLLTEYKLENSIPAGSVRKHYSRFVQDLAKDLWQEHIKE